MPTARLEVVNVVVPLGPTVSLPSKAISELEVALSKKATVPLGGEGKPLTTVAVKATGCPTVDGFGLEANDVLPERRVRSSNRSTEGAHFRRDLRAPLPGELTRAEEARSRHGDVMSKNMVQPSVGVPQNMAANPPNPPLVPCSSGSSMRFGISSRRWLKIVSSGSPSE